MADRGATPDRGLLDRMQSCMSHRGPDGAELWTDRGIGLAHRRLAVVEMSELGVQPMLWVRDAAGICGMVNAGSGRLEDSGEIEHALVYNGELYNDEELREELASMGVEFRSRSDSETVLAALATWGESAVDRFRGMYALASVDLRRRRVLLARDPLGIKPLYYAMVQGGGNPALVFASEPRAVLSNGSISRKPDMVTVSAYLTTIRTTLGRRTLYAGVSCLEPGERVVFEARDGALRSESRSWWDRRAHGLGDGSPSAIRLAMVDSVGRHLRSDVPVCCLLSGGIDSSIICRVARGLTRGPMTTFCAGADEGAGSSDDFVYAREMAEALGAEHVEARVTEAMFRERWETMVTRMGVPLSTPNEVAINEVARTLRARGYTVALSGEGADELFGGYDVIMNACRGHIEQSSGGAWRKTGGRFHLDLAAWVGVGEKDAVLSHEALAAAERDQVLLAEYARFFAESARGLDESNASAVESHLRFQRRVNLQGLLLRLDQATMQESVEGRTPFADQEIARLAESLSMQDKFRQATEGQADGQAQTKIAIRRAFQGDLPSTIVTRPKASFPLPFQGWMQNARGLLAGSPARTWFTPAALALVEADPARAWKFAWPMMNLGLWSRQF